MEASSSVFEALSDPTRVRILVLLAAKGELCVCNIFGALDMSQPRISRHLAVLRRAKVVKSRRSGRWIYYSLDESRLREASAAIDGIISTPTHTLPQAAPQVAQEVCD